MIPCFLSPDCDVSKHSACDGSAWDDDADELTACTCECHDLPEPGDPA